MKHVKKLDRSKKTLILLNNLGTPDAPSKEAVRVYLKQFLMDPEVIPYPFIVRWPLVNFLILNTRPVKSAAAYEKIWTKEGSPLLVYSVKQKEKLQKLIPKIDVDLCMRYGNPSIEDRLKLAMKENYEQILFLPLYPQYSTATSKSSLLEFERCLKKLSYEGSYTHVEEFAAQETWISAISKNIKSVMEEISSEHLIMSFHGIPEYMLKNNSPFNNCLSANCCFERKPEDNLCYRAHCRWTAKEIAKTLNLKDEDYTVSFQSRLGPTQWLQPYTDHTIEKLAEKGFKRVAIASPAFTSDCLETLEELAMEGAEAFKEAGGDEFKLVPAVNDMDEFIVALKQIVESRFQSV